MISKGKSEYRPMKISKNSIISLAFAVFLVFGSVFSAYAGVEEDYDNLQKDYDQLKEDYDSLSKELDGLQKKVDATSKDLGVQVYGTAKVDLNWLASYGSGIDPTLPNRSNQPFAKMDVGFKIFASDFLMAIGEIRFINNLGRFFELQQSNFQARKVRIDLNLGGFFKASFGDIQASATPLSLMSSGFFNDYYPRAFGISVQNELYESGLDITGAWPLQGGLLQFGLDFQQSFFKNLIDDADLKVGVYKLGESPNILFNVNELILDGEKLMKLHITQINHFAIANSGGGPEPSTSNQLVNTVVSAKVDANFLQSALGGIPFLKSTVLFGEFAYAFDDYDTTDGTDGIGDVAFYAGVRLSEEVFKDKILSLNMDFRYTGKHYIARGVQTHIYDMRTIANLMPQQQSLSPHIGIRRFRGDQRFIGQFFSGPSYFSSIYPDQPFGRSGYISSGTFQASNDGGDFINYTDPLSYATRNRTGINLDIKFQSKKGDEVPLDLHFNAAFLSEQDVTFVNTVKGYTKFGLDFKLDLNSFLGVSMLPILEFSSLYQYISRADDPVFSTTDESSDLNLLWFAAGITYPIVKGLNILAGFQYFNAAGYDYVDNYNHTTLALDGFTLNIFNTQQTVMTLSLEYVFMRDAFISGGYTIYTHEDGQSSNLNYLVDQIFIYSEVKF